MLNLLDMLFTAAPVIGTIVGLIVAGIAWWLLPDSVDRASIGGWIVGAGFVCGLVWTGVSKKSEKT